MNSAGALTLALAGIGDGLLGKGMALATCDPARQARRLAKWRLMSPAWRVRAMRLMARLLQRLYPAPATTPAPPSGGAFFLSA
jgi:hypothetical protein